RGCGPALQLQALQWGVGSWRSAAVDLELPAGRTFVLLGSNGAGKSALLDTLAGFLPARAGRVLLGRRDLTALPPEQRRIGYMFQRDALFPHWNIERNLRFARGAGTDLEGLLDALELRPWLAHEPDQLSGGQRQRVALARALVGAPELVLLDEPLSAIDPQARPALRRTLARLLRERGVSTVLVTHDASDARMLGDLVGVLDGGRLLQSGAVATVFDNPCDLRAARLLGFDNLWPLEVLGLAAAGAATFVDLGPRDTRVRLLRCRADPAAAALRIGSRVMLALRAEAITPCAWHGSDAPAQGDASWMLAATLQALRCEGPLWRWQCALPCGLEAEAYTLPEALRRLKVGVGEPLGLRLHLPDLRLLADAPGAG
ncbi:MAG: ABC transporter ATP-binding protein, partial [Burkholderiales bacterium]|nr:ABC transporter ATP-binding protein [Burkholderiales bacterium]